MLALEEGYPHVLRDHQSPPVHLGSRVASLFGWSLRVLLGALGGRRIVVLFIIPLLHPR